MTEEAIRGVRDEDYEKYLKYKKSNSILGAYADKKIQWVSS